MGHKRSTRLSKRYSDSDDEEPERVIRKRRRYEDEGSRRTRSSSPEKIRRRKGKRVVQESETSSDTDYDRKIVLKKRQSRTKGKSATYKERRTESEGESSSDNEYEKSAKRKGCIPSRKRKRAKNTVSKWPDSMHFKVNNILHTSSSDGSMAGQMEPSNCFGNVDIDKSAAYYRSNIKTCLKDLNDLKFKDHHLDELKLTPFWMFFDVLYRFGYNALNKRCTKSEHDIRQILKAFDDRSATFMVAGVQMIPDKRDVELIFGIHSGSVKIPLKSSEYAISPWVSRCFGDDIRAAKGQYVLYKNIVYEKLKSRLIMDDRTSIKDAARLTLCYMLTTVFTPNQSGSMAWHLTSYMEEFDKICIYNWSQFIVDMLMAQIKSSKTLKAGGCAMLLPYWICEHTTLIRPIDGMGFPRFLKWDLNELHDKLCMVKLTTLARRYLTKLVLKPKTFEKQQFVLMEKFWEKKVSSTENSVEADCDVANEDSDKGRISYCEERFEKNAELNIDGGLEDAVLKGLIDSDCNLEIPATSRIGSSKTVVPEESSFLKSKKIDFEDGDTPSFSLGMTQNETETQKANSVIHSVLDEIRVQHVQVEGDGLLQVCPFVQSVEEKNIGDPASVFGQFDESFDQGTQLQVVESSKSKTIERLTEELEKVQREKEVISATYLSELEFRDDALVKLRQENEELNMQLKEMNVQTPTQFYENPANMEMLDNIEELHLTKQKNAELLKENADLLKENAEKQSSLVKYNIDQPLFESQRTENDGRVAKDVTPQISTLEMINLCEGDNEDADDDTPLIKRFRRKQKAGKFRWDAKFWAVRKTTEYIKELLQEIWTEGGEGTAVWSGKEPMALVTADNVLGILHHERIPSNVIDAWGEILLQKYAHAPGGKKTMVFSSICWKLIADHPTGEDRTLQSFVDNRLEDAMDVDWLLFPINTSGNKKSRRDLGDHWTIIKLNMRQGQWQFFNSMRPRTNDGADVHLNNALILVEYVEKRMNDVFKRNRPNHPSLRFSMKVVAIDCLQQLADSVDCGIIVCHHIENTIAEKKARKGEFSQLSSGNYRKKMVEWFLDPLNVEV
ncbi:hypothetical protein ACS0TY_008892 [Phlomoides rotata]